MPLIDYLFVTPLAEEWRAAQGIFRHGAHMSEQQTPHGVFYRWREETTRDSGHPGHLVVGAPIWVKTPGQAQAAAFLGRAIASWAPRNIVVLGIAGSVQPDDVRLGDVLVPPEVVGYEVSAIDEHLSTAARRRRSTEGGAARWRRDMRISMFSTSVADIAQVMAFRNSSEYLDWQEDCFDAARKLRLRLNGRRPCLHEHRLLGSGNEVVRSTAFAKALLRKDPRLGAVAMEEIGLNRAIEYHQGVSAPLFVRAISDYADGNKATLEKESRDAWRRFAAENAARLVQRLIRRRQDPSIALAPSLDMTPGRPRDLVAALGRDFSDGPATQLHWFPRLFHSQSMPSFTLTVRGSSRGGLQGVGLLHHLRGNGAERVQRREAVSGEIRFEVERSAEPQWIGLALRLRKSSRISLVLTDEFGRCASSDFP